jgi:hypothetical protein
MTTEMTETKMKLSKLIIKKLCILPLVILLPPLGTTACTAQKALNSAADVLKGAGDGMAIMSDSLREAAPSIQDDLENAWYRLSGDMREVPETVDLSQTPPALAEAQEARDKLISGASFADMVSNAASQVTAEDIERINSGDFGALNGILPFEIDVNSVSEDLAAVLNSLDIGQVSAILQSDAGYHLIQLLDENGGHIRIGHLLFQVDPVAGEPTVEEPTIDEPGEEPAEELNPLQQAINSLAAMMENRGQ